MDNLFRYKVARCFIILATLGIFSCQKETNTPESKPGEIVIFRTTGLNLFVGGELIANMPDFTRIFNQPNILCITKKGMSIEDILAGRDNLIFKHNPSRLFMYVDDRNVRTTSVSSFSEQINILIQDFTHRLPKSKLIFISIKPSLPYLNYYHKQAEFNAFLRGVSFSCKNIEYIDLWNPLLLKQGVMNLSLYKEDQQTLNEQGYHLLIEKVGPHMSKNE
ncbi:hypothetical protein DWW78_10455 [Alistipes indistinctus]|jgi:hypothetical protein|uniref:hypothetical protein n=1 Tax=Alistipes indistinctus TaxID=626932 RepID=UPI000E492D9F|nr:hypothetical protein [Alistipes indistinctus]RGU35689.1 hypothetical protein DWW78_10455 [Alistipes indistinctus]